VIVLIRSRESGKLTTAGRLAPANAIAPTARAAARFSIGGLKATRAHVVLLAGALAAAAGAALIAAAPTLFIAGLGLAAAAAGTAVLFPILLGIVSRNVDEYHRGRATSVVTTVSYLGFLLGPVYVGLWADAVGLRGAMVAVAALAVGLFVLAPALLRFSGFGDPGRHNDVENDGALRGACLRRIPGAVSRRGASASVGDGHRDPAQDHGIGKDPAVTEPMRSH
jgi:MFS family permease